MGHLILINLCERKITKPNHRRQWAWTLSTKQTRPFFNAILPHLIIKKELVKLAIKYLDLLALPAHERRDYSITVNGIDPRTGNKRKYSKPMLRPKWVAKRDKIITEIRKINGRGFNAMRKN